MTPQQANELPPLPLSVHVIRDGLGGIAFYAYAPEEMEAYARAAIAWNRRAPAPTEPAVDRDAAFDFRAHLARQAAWSEKTFGPGPRTKGVCDHIRKELIEVEADPLDLKEWVDVVILALDGAWRCGGKPDEIIAGIVAKQTKNEGRVWPDWRTADPDKAIEHDRSHDVATPASPAVPDDPMDWPLPCDVTVGAGTIKAGCKLRTLVARMNVMNDMIREGWASAVPEPAPLAPSEQQRVMDALIDARAMAMRNTVEARVPESGDFGAIAQNLDWAITTMQASQPTSAEELQQKEHIPPSRAEPASQLDACFPVLTDERIAEISRAFRNASGLVLMDLSFARAIEAELTSRCRAQGGITNDSKGLPTSSEGMTAWAAYCPVGFQFIHADQRVVEDFVYTRRHCGEGPYSIMHMKVSRPTSAEGGQ